VSVRKLASSTSAALLSLCFGCSTEGVEPEQASAVQFEALVEPELDVLFVIDDTPSMVAKQQKLAREIPRMVDVLTRGDRYARREAEVPPGLIEKARTFRPVTSLHLGVVSTNFGGLLNVPANQHAAVRSCEGVGDDGRLQQDLSVAIQGIAAQRYTVPYLEPGTTLLAPEPACALGPQPTFQSYVDGDDPAQAATAFGCVARLGIEGCPFEQPLESMWKALAPSSGPASASIYQFIDGSAGQGDRHNQGFLRPDAALAVIVLTDEDDCSITEQGRELIALDYEYEQTLGPINMRCARAENDAARVLRLERYREALLSLKPGHPERVVFTVIGGVPPEAIARGDSLDQILASPEMQVRASATDETMPAAACSGGEHDQAQPARRLVQLAKLLPRSVVASICAADYAPAVDQVVERLAPLMGE
jgi:hypothetical protein